MNRWQTLADLADSQHGVLTREQLQEAGFSQATVSRLASERGWSRPHPGVYLLPGAARDFRATVLAAQLALRVPSLATGATAAHLYNLLPAPEVVHLVIDEVSRVRAPAAAVVKRSRTIARSEQARMGAIVVATPVRMVIDYAGWANAAQLRSLLIDARQRRLLSLPDLAARVDTMGPVRGRGVLRRMVWELDAERCDSVLEERVRKLLRAGGVPSPAPEPVAVRVAGRVLSVDIAWPACRVGVEVDGFSFHSSRAHLDKDHRRGNALTLAGWSILRVGWDRIHHDPDGFIREVARLLSRNAETPAHIRASVSRLEERGGGRGTTGAGVAR